ncbi:hypothetical protein KIW84_044056 [Lathyrus oleraceus]|uniref:Uncharacterized protein n=1 Tax=Pisum sativum TaxID=3888 RepID=A0A9D4XFK7_PEA|nr:hypothetical protein KIW84_044056 [Pisum sativum]
MVDLPIKEDKFGIGYEPLQAEQNAGPSTFTSTGLMNHGDVFATDGEDCDNDCNVDVWVRPCAPGESINNWTAEEVVQVTLLTESDMLASTVNNPVIAQYDFNNPVYQAEEESEEDCELPAELVRLLKQEERVIQPHQEELEIVNLGTEDARREIKIGAALEDSVKRKLIEMLREYVEIFA